MQRDETMSRPLVREFKDELWHPLLRLKVTHAVLREVNNQLHGQPVRSPAAYEVYAQAIQGWMIELFTGSGK